jgi:hypothetical protein
MGRTEKNTSNSSSVISLWLGKHIPAAINTHATREELLDALFSMQSVSYKRNIGDQFFPQLVSIFGFLF